MYNSFKRELQNELRLAHKKILNPREKRMQEKAVVETKKTRIEMEIPNGDREKSSTRTKIYMCGCWFTELIYCRVIEYFIIIVYTNMNRIYHVVQNMNFHICIYAFFVQPILAFKPTILLWGRATFWTIKNIEFSYHMQQFRSHQNLIWELKPFLNQKYVAHL